MARPSVNPSLYSFDEHDDKIVSLRVQRAADRLRVSDVVIEEDLYKDASQGCRRFVYSLLSQL